MNQLESEPQRAAHLVRRLRGAGQRLPARLRQQILELGRAAVPPLIKTLEDHGLARANAPGGGFAPVHAAELLGELRAPDAVEPMLRALARTDWMDWLHDGILRSLPEIGPPVLEPALRLYAEAGDRELRVSVAAVLARVGVHDDRTLRILKAELREDPSMARNLAEYGDPRAVECLSRALDEYEIEEGDSSFRNQALVELQAAIEELGGRLTPEQAEKIRGGLEPAEKWRRQLSESLQGRSSEEPEEPVRPRAPGRNDPCWCGSQKKYKKCHLAADDAAAHEHRRHQGTVLKTPNSNPA